MNNTKKDIVLVPSDEYRSSNDMLHEIDKRVAELAVDMKYAKQSIAKIEENNNKIFDKLDNMQFVTPDVLSEYIKSHEVKHEEIEARLSAVEDQLKLDSQSLFRRLQRRFGDRIVDIVITIIVIVVFMTILKLGANDPSVPRVLL